MRFISSLDKSVQIVFDLCQIIRMELVHFGIQLHVEIRSEVVNVHTDGVAFFVDTEDSDDGCFRVTCILYVLYHSLLVKRKNLHGGRAV